jgi:hypothetical protein
MPRCCTPVAGEFVPCYASVLVAPDLKKAVEELEQGQLQSSVTAWCPSCQAPYLLTGAMGLFASPSAHHAHVISFSRVVLQAGQLPR